MKKLSNSKIMVIIFVVLGIFAACIVLVYGNNAKTKAGMTKVKDYNHVAEGEVTCMALTPECGYCPGEVIDKECYVKAE